MAVDTIEGVWQDSLRYHYDVTGDVLYLRLISRLEDEVYAEEDENGVFVLRSLGDDSIVGMKIVGYWRQYGAEGSTLGELADWQQRLDDSVATVGRKLLAA